MGREKCPTDCTASKWSCDNWRIITVVMRKIILGRIRNMRGYVRIEVVKVVLDRERVSTIM